MENVSLRIEKAFRERNTRSKEKRLYFLLYESIRNTIKNATIPANENLPASRKLAEMLSVSRSTVLKAYDLLLLEGYISAKKGSCYFVKSIAATNIKKNFSEQHRYAALSEKGESFQKNINLINRTDDKSVAFRPGVPPLDIFPVTKWKNLTTLYWRQIKFSALTYSPSSGNDQLKKNLANYLNLSRGIKCDSNQIVIVSGSLQSLYLIGSVLINSHDKVVMENPTFPNVHSIFKSLNATILGVDVDQKGINTPFIHKQEFENAKLIHTTPSCHYPTSAILSLKRRKKLLKWANANGTFIIENDYEHEVTNYKQSLPPLFSLDQENRTIYMGTFNRLLHPSIRIGYMVLPPPLIDPVKALMNHSHRFVTPSIQVVLNQFMEKKMLYTHIKDLIATAHQRKKIFLESFQEHFGSEFEFLNEQSESLHLLGRFKTGENSESLIPLFAQKHILTHAYSKCFVKGTPDLGLIFGYASVKGPLIRQKIEQMAQIYKKSKR